MFFKTLFLFFIGAALAYHLRDTPEELKEYWTYVDTEVKHLQHEAEIEIRSYLEPLADYILRANRNVITNITDAATPYWANISAAQEAAKETGQNITSCLDLGNNQLYALNNSIVQSARKIFDNYNETAYNIILESSTEAYSVVEELIALGQEVAQCNDDACATDLMKTSKQFLDTAISTLVDSTTKPRDYVLINLPDLLGQYHFDTNAYVANSTTFFTDIVDCIDNL